MNFCFVFSGKNNWTSVHYDESKYRQSMQNFTGERSKALLKPLSKVGKSSESR